MTGRTAALALALALGMGMGACIPPTTPPPSPSASPSGSATSQRADPSQSQRSPASTPATIFAIDVGRRPAGPWAVTFQEIGTEAVREVYDLAAACAEATCDIDATIQTFAGESLGTGVFQFADGMYRYEADRTEKIACFDGFEMVADGATRVSHTILVIAGYRALGTSAITVDIRGTRAVQVTPADGSGCPPETFAYIANGQPTQFAAAPSPTPKDPAPATIPVIGDSFFGSGAKVVTYAVGGSSVEEIIASIQTAGPFSDWLHARAEALTRAVPRYRFVLSDTAGHCHIQVTKKPAIIFTFTITLPSWSRPKRVDQATVLWWAKELTRVATHENHHVEIYRDGAARMTAALGTSTCANVADHLTAIVRDIDTAQCEFDLKEYGSALGLSLTSCLTR
jgi:predicted secreted Zn-dependent protease